MTSPGGSNLEMAGGVGVEVYPDTTGFSQKLGAKILPEAKKLGAQLAKEISASISRSIADAVTDGMRRSSTGARAQATRIGEAIGADMGRAIRARLDVAMRNLPNAKIGVDLDNSDVAAVRAELAKLRDKTVTINAEVTQAYVDISTLRAEIASLPRRVTVKIDADTLDALAEIEALKAELAALRSGANRPAPGPSGGGRGGDPGEGSRGYDEVDQAARRAKSSVGGLMAAGILLGPAIIPVAAAAAAAIAGIGVAAAGVGAGLAVGLIGLSGIPGAVKALGEQQGSAAQNAATLAGRQRSLTDAETALGDARVGAADASRRAAQAVRNADLGLADAQRQAARSQLALNDARIAAKRALEDYQAQLAHLRLDEKQASMDMERAAANLMAAKQGLAPQNASGPSNQVTGGVRPDFVAPTIANPRAIEEAQLAFDNAQLRMNDLQRQQGRVSEDNAKAQAKGIEGSDQVVAAQEQIRASLQAVQAAQQAVTEARISEGTTARQNARSITAAQQAVVDAQKGVTDAVLASTAGVTKAFKDMSPAGQEFARFIYGLRPELMELRREAETGFLPGLQRGIAALLPALPAVRTAVRQIAVEMGGLAQRAGEALAGPFWQDWFRFMTGQAVTALQTFGDIAGSTARAVAGIVRAFAPLGQEFGRGLADLMERFAHWANSLDENAGFARLLDYIRSEGPVAAAALGEIWTLFTRLVEAAAPIGSVVIRVLGGLALVLDHMPLWVLTALVVGVQAFVLASKGAAVWAVFGPMITGVIGGIGAAFRDVAAVAVMAMGDARNAARNAAQGGATAFGSMWAGIKTGASSAASGVGLLASSFGPQAGLMIGITAVTIGLAYLFEQTAKKARESKQRVDDLAQSFLGLAQAQDQGKQSSDDYVRQQIAGNDLFRQTAITAQHLGIDVNTLGGHIRGNGEDVKKVNDTFRNYIDTLTQFKQIHDSEISAGLKVDPETQKFYDQVQKEFGVSVDELLPKLKEQNQSLGESGQKYREIAKALGLAITPEQQFERSMGDIKTALQGASPSAEEFKSAIQGITSITPGAAVGFDALAAMSDKVATSQLSASEKAGAFRDILGGIGQATELHGPKFDALSVTFGRIAESELGARDKADLLRGALDQLYGAVESQVEAEEARVRAQSQFNAQMHTNKAGFDLQAAAAGKNADAILANRDALELALKTSRDKAVQDIANGEEIEKVRVRLKDQTDALVAQLPETQRNSTAVNQLVQQYGAIPPNVSTKYTADDSFKQLYQQLQQVWFMQQAVKRGDSPEEAQRRWNEQLRFQKGAIGAMGIPMPSDSKADGGLLSGPWMGPKADNLLIRANPREFVHQVSAVDYYGVEFLDALNQRLIPREVLPGYANGGQILPPGMIALPPFPTRVDAQWPVPVDLSKMWIPSVGDAVNAVYGGGGSLTGTVAQAMEFLQAQVGKPYRWASAGPEGYDCSGIVSAVWNVLRGVSPYRHTFSTYDEARYFSQPGRGGVLSAGWSNPGEEGVGGSGVGHTAGVLAGVPFESIGGQGVRIGKGVTPLGAFAHMGNIGKYDAGGYLPTGFSTVFNGTGKPEPVFTTEQWKALVDSRRPTAPSGGDTHYTTNVYPQRADLKVGDLLAIQARQEALSRVGRPR